MTTVSLNLKDNRIGLQARLINDIRNELNEEDIQLGDGRTFQVTSDGLARMVEVLDSWGSTPGIKNVRGNLDCDFVRGRHTG